MIAAHSNEAKLLNKALSFAVVLQSIATSENVDHRFSSVSKNLRCVVCRHALWLSDVHIIESCTLRVPSSWRPLPLLLPCRIPCVVVAKLASACFKAFKKFQNLESVHAMSKRLRMNSQNCSTLTDMKCLTIIWLRARKNGLVFYTMFSAYGCYQRCEVYCGYSFVHCNSELVISTRSRAKKKDFPMDFQRHDNFWTANVHLIETPFACVSHSFSIVICSFLSLEVSCGSTIARHNAIFQRELAIELPLPCVWRFLSKVHAAQHTGLLWDRNRRMIE